jgi:hypothetical protein
MNLRRRRFLLVVALTAATATSAFGQGAAAPPGAAKEGAGSIPDLSGIWGRWFTFEPPPSGPGPVVSRLRRGDGTMILSVVGDYANPILRPDAAATIRRIGEMELGGRVLPNPHNQCWPEPTPFTLSIQLGVQVIQQKDKVVLLYLSDHQVRQVRLNVPHSAQPVPSWQGESVGHYEGDTLVIDTIGQKVGPLSMIDRYGTPFSPALHVVERYRLIDGATARDLQQKHEGVYFGAGKSAPPINAYGRGDIDPDPAKPGLRVEITVDDPATFTMPWTAFVTYRPVQGLWPEAVCAENIRGAGASWVTLVPEAAKPDF